MIILKNTDFNQVFAHEIKNKLYENKFSKTLLNHNLEY